MSDGSVRPADWQRLASAGVLIPLVLWVLLYKSTWLFTGLCVLMSVGLLYEWHRLRNATMGTEFYLAVAVGWGVLATPLLGENYLIPSILILFLMGMLTHRVLRYDPDIPVVGTVGFTLFGLIYCVFPLWLAIMLQQQPNGGELLCYLCAVVWGTDSGAYLFGRRFGRHKMTPRLSPGKTWEGFIGGTVIGIVAGWLAGELFAFTIHPVAIVMMSVVLALASHLGDLMESLLKREFRVKDSGAIIPGHGGLLDRLDSLLLVVPVFMAIQLVVRMV